MFFQLLPAGFKSKNDISFNPLYEKAKQKTNCSDFNICPSGLLCHALRFLKILYAGQKTIWFSVRVSSLPKGFVIFCKNIMPERLETLFFILQNQLLIVEDFPDLLECIKTLHSVHEREWFDNYKPFGREVWDVRYSEVEGRMRHAIKRISAYIPGKVKNLPELEETKAPP